VDAAAKSSTKPEVHNTLHCHQKRTEAWPQVTCTENILKFGRVDICEQTYTWTDSQTYRQTSGNNLHT